MGEHFNYGLKDLASPVGAITKPVIAAGGIVIREIANQNAEEEAALKKLNTFKEAMKMHPFVLETPVNWLNEQDISLSDIDINTVEGRDSFVEYLGSYGIDFALYNADEIRAALGTVSVFLHCGFRKHRKCVK